MCPQNTNNLKNIEISDGIIPDDREPKKLKTKKKPQPKPKKPEKKNHGIKSLTVPLLKEQLRQHGLSVAGKKAVLVARLEEAISLGSCAASASSAASTSFPFGAILPENTTTTTPMSSSPATTTLIVENQAHHQQHSPPIQQQVQSHKNSHVVRLNDPPERETDTASMLEDENNIACEDIGEMVEYQLSLDRGLVQNPRCSQPLVQTYVDENGGNSRGVFFRNLDDTTGGFAGLADPDEFIDLGASDGNL
eukprot:scaffold122103_cov24-Attheya_sp.AAC.1